MVAIYTSELFSMPYCVLLLPDEDNCIVVVNESWLDKDKTAVKYPTRPISEKMMNSKIIEWKFALYRCICKYSSGEFS